MQEAKKEEVLEEVLEDLEKESQADQTEDSVKEAETTEDTASETEEKDTEETAEETEGSSKEDSDDNKKGFFKKKKDKKDEQIEDLTDRLRRQMAEFENFRKRTEKEKSQMFDMGAKTIVEKVLPVIDNFERGLAAVPEDKKEDAFVVGMDKIYKQFLTTLEEAGVKPIRQLDRNLIQISIMQSCMWKMKSWRKYSSGRTSERLYVQRRCGKTQHGKGS